jgi:hypothetical protein
MLLPALKFGFHLNAAGEQNIVLQITAVRLKVEQNQLVAGIV